MIYFLAISWHLKYVQWKTSLPFLWILNWVKADLLALSDCVIHLSSLNFFPFIFNSPAIFVPIQEEDLVPLSRWSQGEKTTKQQQKREIDVTICLGGFSSHPSLVAAWLLGSEETACICGNLFRGLLASLWAVLAFTPPPPLVFI